MRRIDTLTNGYKIIQDDKAFCFGIDAVLLASFVKLKPAESVIDLGTGNAIIPLLLCAKAEKLKSSHTKEKCRFTGIEIQDEAVKMAQESVALNSLENQITIISGDIKDVKNLPSLQPALQKTDVVVSNPPYMLSERVKENATDAKSIARHEVLCTLDDIIKSAACILKQNGRFYLIHRPYRLQEIFSSLEKYHLTPRRMQLVYPSIEASPEMVMLECRPRYKSDLKIEKPLIMYDSNHEYTKDFKTYCGLKD